jgi:hypothetical protein
VSGQGTGQKQYGWNGGSEPHATGQWGHSCISMEGRCSGDVLLALQTIYVAARAASPWYGHSDGNVLGNLGHRSSVV